MITAADGTAFTGAVSVLYTIDNGTQTAGGGTAPAHEGNGYHSYTPLQAETNGDHIAFTFTGTGAILSTVQVYTTFPQTGDSFTLIGATGSGLTTLATQASVNVIDGIVDNILLDTAEIGTAGAGLTNINLPNQTMDIVGNITGNLSGSVGSVTGAVGSVTGSVGSVTAGVTVTTNSDKTGYSISGAKTTLDALNDIAATDVVSAGAITTLAGAVSNVTTVATTTTNTDMRGTDSALLAASINLTGGAVDRVTLTDTTTTNTDMRGTDNALLAASINLTGGTIDRVTLVDTTTTNTDMRGTDSAATPAQVNAEMVDVLTVDTYAEPGSVPAATASLKDKIGWLMALARNKLLSTATTISLRNDAQTGDIATAGQSDDGTTYTRDEYS
jgi:hypothetical protein